MGTIAQYTRKNRRARTEAAAGLGFFVSMANKEPRLDGATETVFTASFAADRTVSRNSLQHV
jgi:hypothetical protein